MYGVISYGADPTGKSDSTEAILKALSDAFNGPREGSLIEGIANLGGAEIHLEGGNYLISKPLRLPDAGVGNLMVGSHILEHFFFVSYMQIKIFRQDKSDIWQFRQKPAHVSYSPNMTRKMDSYYEIR